jgi:hypothetical protein
MEGAPPLDAGEPPAPRHRIAEAIERLLECLRPLVVGVVEGGVGEDVADEARAVLAGLEGEGRRARGGGGIAGGGRGMAGRGLDGTWCCMEKSRLS